MEHEPDEFAPSQQAVYVPDDRRIRHDGWTIARQEKFLRRLAGCGCVAHACAAVGMSRQSFYDLHDRPGADGYRRAVEAALDAATSRLDEGAFSRSIHGVPRPIFYKGEQVGEYRHYDERLTMFLLRYRDPTRYGAWLDGYEARRHPDGAGITLAHALNRVLDAAYGAEPFHHEEPDVPLAEGPVDPVPAHARAYDGPAEAEDLFRMIAQAGEDERAAARADPAAAEGRSTLTVRRPRQATPERT